jgi:hypothetical protein
MRPAVVQKFYVLPAQERLCGKLGVKKGVSPSVHLRYLKLLYLAFELELDGGITGVPSGALDNASQVLSFAYNNLSIKPRIAGVASDDEFETVFGVNTGGARSIATRGLTLNDPLVVLLRDRGGFFSLEALRGSIGLIAELHRRHKQDESTLDSILFDGGSRSKR